MTTCRICSRPLRSVISIAVGVGPVCLKKVRQELAAHRAQSISEISTVPSYALTDEELRRVSEEKVREAYQERRRNTRRRPSASPVQVQIESRTRRQENETATVSWISPEVATVTTEGGGEYQTTLTSCTCPHYRNRVARFPEEHRAGCRHMQALRLALDEVSERRRARRRRNNTAQQPANTREAAQLARPLFSAVSMTDEAAREEVLNTWRENRGFDGIWMSRDDAVYHQLLEEAEGEWEYDTSGTVLGGTGNTFGVEFEMEFNEYGAWDRVIRDLHSEGLTSFESRQGYHTSGVPGLWTPTRDGSLKDGGLEIVSPILTDKEEDWKELALVLEIARTHGAKVNSNTGSHVHIGIGPLDHRTYSWQRLARIGLAHERTLYRLGGANSDSYRENGMPGKHRGTSYSAPFSRDVSFGGQISPQEARRMISADRYKLFNTTNIDGSSRRPAIEMRYPNGTLDPKQVQAQVIVANAMVHQAAVIRNSSPQDSTTPRFSETNLHDRLSGSRMDEETAFRRFLDVLGNPIDRKAAAWLWKRGRAPR